MVAVASAAARAEAARAEAQGTPARRAGEASKRAAERKRSASRLASMAEEAEPAVLARSPLGAQRSALLSSTRIQPAMAISQPGDAAEMEADRVAAQIVAMPEPGVRPAVGGGTSGVQRSPLVVQRAPAGPADNVADPATEEAVKKELSGGAPMAPDVAEFFGRRFKADFSGVRIHTDGRAQNLSTRLGARAFTYGRHVFFNAGQYNPDSADGARLIAHELTHTIQQQAAIQLKEAETPRVANRTARRAQRGIVSRALNWIADKANYIPGYRLFTIVIGVNPINMSKVERSGANILRALIEFIPGGGLIVDALNNHGIFEKGGKFIEDQFRSLGMVGSAFRDALMEFIDSLGWSDIFHLGDVWDRAKRIFTAPVDRLIAFGKGLVTGIANIVKDAILKPLGRYAARVVPKWDLLVGVFGKNPISDEGQGPAATLIGAFMELIGQKEVWDNIQKGGAVAKAWAWFKSVLSEAFAMVKSIPGQFVATLKSLTIMDIVTIVGAWVKFAKLFGGFVVQFINWAGGKVLRLLEIILEVVAPSVIPYLKKAGGAFRTIIRAPGRFIGNLVRAGKAGFNQFKANIVAHLKRGIFDWLLGSIAEANIYIPRSFDLKEILKFGLSVVGLTWANIRAKLVAATNETVVVALETGFELVRTLVTQGPMAAWQQFLEHLSNLKQMAMDAIIDFIKGEVIRVAIEKVVSMFIPAAAFIQALLSIYRTVMFVVNEIKRIAAVVAAIIDGISAIANGVIGAAAGRVENILARGLSLAISFLANFAGLGNVSRKVVDIVKKIRAPVDKALDKVIAWIVAQAKKLGKMLIGSDNKPVPPAKKDVPGDGELGESISFDAGEEQHRLWVKKDGESARIMLASTAKPLTVHLGEFSTKAAALKDPAEKGKVTGAIAFVLPIAQTIESDAKTAASKRIGAPDRDKLDKKIEKNERTIRPKLKVILDGLGMKVPDKITRISCKFIKGAGAADPANNGEYAAQLARQQQQINAMSVHIWMERRSQFITFSRQSNAKTLDARARNAVRARIQDAIAQRLTKPINEPATTPAVSRVNRIGGAPEIVAEIFGKVSSSTRYRGLSEGTAIAMAADAMKGKAVLHEPDKVAGGRYNEIQGVGSNAVNGDIGANWGGRIFGPETAGRIHIANTVQQKIRDEMTKKKVAQALWRGVKMDLSLDPL